MARAKAERRTFLDDFGGGQDACRQHTFFQCGRFCKRLEVVTARRKKDVPSQIRRNFRRFLVVCDVMRLFIIERRTLSLIADIRDAARAAGAHGIFGYIRRIRMACIDEDSDAMRTAILRQCCFIERTIVDDDARISRQKLLTVTAHDRRRDTLPLFEQKTRKLPAVLRACCHEDHTS